MKKCVIYNPYKNQTVTSEYVNLLEDSLRTINIDTIKTNQLTKVKRSDRIGALVVLAKDAFIARMKGYRPIIYWKQGIDPEESFIRNSSHLRSLVLSIFDILGLRFTDALIVVSDRMVQYLKDKYRYSNNNYYVMPCFNSEINEDSFKYEGKYLNNIFLYAGGMQKWQCFYETAVLFKNIEEKYNKCHFRVLTKEKEEAEEIVKKVGIINYSIAYVEPEEISDEMKKAKFGFSLRENNIVNNVATPTKLSTYISNGVIPIYSSSLMSFHEMAANNPYCICVETNCLQDVDDIIKKCKEDIDSTEVLSSYKNTFGEYYSRKYHKKRLSLFFVKALSNWLEV